MLLGKSSKDNQFVSLLGHTEDVCDSAIALFGHPDRLTRLGHAWLRFFKLMY